MNLALYHVQVFAWRPSLQKWELVETEWMGPVDTRDAEWSGWPSAAMNSKAVARARVGPPPYLYARVWEKYEGDPWQVTWEGANYGTRGIFEL